MAERTCPSCGENRWDDFLATSSGRVMTGDQRIIGGALRKISCRACGVVANEMRLTREQLDDLYGRDYILNTVGKEEHMFFTSAGPVPRSRMYFEWIVPHLPPGFRSLIEIGCGQGCLLERLRDAYPGRRMSGIEGSIEAARLAQRKGLRVLRRLLHDERELLDAADVIVAVCVLEHVEEPEAFLGTARAALSEQGRLILSIPVQDYPGYDLFFAEHVWHFTVDQAACLLRRNGLRVICADARNATNPGYALFVCQPDRPAGALPIKSDVAKANRDHWLGVFQRIDAWVEQRRPGRVALFGSSEVATLMLTFTRLGQAGIVAFLDEDPNKIGSRKHDIPVNSPEWLSRGEVDAVVLTINPEYHARVGRKLARHGLPVYSFAGSSVERIV